MGDDFKKIKAPYDAETTNPFTQGFNKAMGESSDESDEVKKQAKLDALKKLMGGYSPAEGE